MVVIFCYTTTTLNFVSVHSKTLKGGHMKKYVVFFGILVLGAFIMIVVDDLLGTTLNDVSFAARTTHNVAHILWGGIMMGAINKMF